MYPDQTYQTYLDLNSPRDSFPVAWLKRILKRRPKSYYHSVSVWSESILHNGSISIDFFLRVLSSVAGGAVSRVDPDSTGLNPSWRRAISEVVIGVSWDEGSTADFISQQIDQLKEMILTLDELTTDSGSYFNEVKINNLTFALIELKLIHPTSFRYRVLFMNSISRNHFSVHITINWNRSKINMILLHYLLSLLA